MSDRPVISVDELSKVYYADIPTENIELRSRLKNRRTVLSDINFELYRGQVLGIIGNNGSGKSTLLKIIAGITKPTTGKVITNGRIASILEIGTGFHPELTGKENVFLSASILGMSDTEVKVVYNDIVDFSGLAGYMDMPIKRYSSGMFMRLAFSIIVHINADILLLDEVFSVGDSPFRRKCDEKLKELSHSDTTIIMVSHDLENVLKTCSHCLALENGTTADYGETRAVVDSYFLSNYNKLNSDKIGFSADVSSPDDEDQTMGQETPSLTAADALRERQGGEVSWEITNAPGNEMVSLLSVWFQDESGNRSANFDESNSITIGCTFQSYTETAIVPAFLLSYRGESPSMILNARNGFLPQESVLNSFSQVGVHNAACTIPSRLLNHGLFFLSVYFLDESANEVFSEDLVSYFCLNRNLKELLARGDCGVFNGSLNPKLHWKIS